MKISIITACYNRAATIGGAIESVLAQDYPNIEYILVDGASNDGTLEIIEQYKDRIHTIVSEHDSGMYEALNKGIRLATGDVVGIVHSDDILFAPDTISRVVRAMEETQADFLYADGLFVNEKDIQKVVRNWKGGHFSSWKIRHGWLPLHPTCYIRRSLFKVYGMYDESFRISADTDLLLRFLQQPLKITYLPEYLVRMRMGGLSTDKRRRKQMWHEDIRAFRKNNLSPVRTKLMKMIWKVPQFITPLLQKKKI